MGTGKGNENIPWIYRGIDFQTLGKQIKKYRVLRGFDKAIWRSSFLVRQILFPG